MVSSRPLSTSREGCPSSPSAMPAVDPSRTGRGWLHGCFLPCHPCSGYRFRSRPVPGSTALVEVPAALSCDLDRKLEASISCSAWHLSVASGPLATGRSEPSWASLIDRLPSWWPKGIEVRSVSPSVNPDPRLFAKLVLPSCSMVSQRVSPRSLRLCL